MERELVRFERDARAMPYIAEHHDAAARGGSGAQGEEGVGADEDAASAALASQRETTTLRAGLVGPAETVASAED
jgi:hypothetical protein